MNDSHKRWLFGGNEGGGQRLRVRRFLLGAGSYLLWALVLVGAHFLGLTSVGADRILALLAGLTATQLIVYAVLRSGLNQRFEDPALTTLQIALGLLWAITLAAFIPGLRGHALMAAVIALLFGIFALPRARFVLLATLGLAGYVGLIVVEVNSGLSQQPLAYHFLSAAVFAIVLIWTTLFGSYVSNLRHRLSRRNAELEEALARNRRLAERDELTDLYNRRFLMDALQRELARADRSRRPLCIAMIDLDHFKNVNDQYGHSTGDRVLSDFGAFLVAELRGMDYVGRPEAPGTVGRYGGEEFMLILPDTDQDAARSCMERLRLGQDRRTHMDRKSPHVTLSAGVAQYLSGETSESLLRRADRALYRAKDTGRNRVCVSL